MTCWAVLRPCTSSGAPLVASTVRSKPTDFSRSANSAWSSAAAERGVSQRPKARKAPRSSGAPASGGNVPTSSGFLWSLAHTTTRWSRRLSMRVGTLQRRVEFGDLAAQQCILLEGAATLANEPDRRDQCGADDADGDRNLDDLERADHRGRGRARKPARSTSRAAAATTRQARPLFADYRPAYAVVLHRLDARPPRSKAPRIRSDTQWTLSPLNLHTILLCEALPLQGSCAGPVFPIQGAQASRITAIYCPSESA